jgi:hypothetical protein
MGKRGREGRAAWYLVVALIPFRQCQGGEVSKSELEAALLFQIKVIGLPPPEQEFRFHPVRRWRFDGAYPDKLLAYEIHGGVWTGGRHVRGNGFTKDCEKYTEAAKLGWRILHFTAKHVNSGEAVGAIEEALND